MKLSAPGDWFSREESLPKYEGKEVRGGGGGGQGGGLRREDMAG